MSLGACLFVLLALMMYTASSDECRTIIVTGALNLQEVVDRLAADEEATANCSIIELPPREHVLSSQTMFPSELGSLEFRGPREGIASVGCRYVAETNYTWYFSEILSLKIHDVHFHDCPRPLRIDTVAEVELNDCSFRSAFYMRSPLCLHCVNCVVNSLFVLNLLPKHIIITIT